MNLKGAFLDRVVRRIDKPTHAKMRWRDRLREGDPQALLMQQVVRPGDTAVDVGANWGLYTVGLSELVGPVGHVIGVEPGPALIHLRAQCARRANVVLLEVALSDRAGLAQFSVPNAPRAAHALSRIGAGGPDAAWSSEVPLTRLDDLDVPSLSRLSFIKIDVEGHEDAVLRGGERVIREARPVLMIEIEERHRTAPVSEAFDLLESLGYDGYVLCPDILVPLAMFDLERDQRAHLVDGDLPWPTPGGYRNDFVFLRSGETPPVFRA